MKMRYIDANLAAQGAGAGGLGMPRAAAAWPFAEMPGDAGEPAKID